MAKAEAQNAIHAQRRAAWCEAGLQEGYRSSRARQYDRRIRANGNEGEGSAINGNSKLKTENARDAVLLDLDIRRDHEDHAGKIAARTAEEIGRTRQHGPHHVAASRRRAQADVPRDRLQAR